MIWIHHAEHGSRFGGPHVFEPAMRHAFQEAYKLLLVEGTRTVGVDFEELLVLVWAKVAMSAGRVTPGVCGGQGVSLQEAGGFGGGGGTGGGRVGGGGAAHQAVCHQTLLKQFGL